MRILTVVTTSALLVLAACSGGGDPAPVAPPTNLGYASNPAIYTLGQVIPPNTATVTGAVSGFSLASALPAGLSLHLSTGAITGTPTALAPAATYTVTASNAGGSTTATVTITVNDQAPGGLVYATNPATYTVGTAIAANLPTSSGGAVTSYGVSPALPAGLVLDPGTGVLSGTPTAPAAAASYTVTASNTGGSTTATVDITVNDQAPSGLAYATNPATYMVGTAIAANLPTSSGGAVTSYGVSPALPAGLLLDPATGVLSGTPTAPASAASYTVTASNTGGSTTTTVVITVNDQAPGALAYATNPATYTVGTAIAANVPTSNGGAVTAYSVSPALPAGLVLDPATGVLSGTPTAPAAAATYTVTASNTGGSTTAALAITVNPLPRFAYITNAGDNTVSMFTVDATTGQLRHNGYVMAGAGPQAVAVDPSGRFAYVANGGSASVSAYAIQAGSGTLTPVGTPVPAGNFPYAVTVDPDGRFAYAANFNSSTVSAYTIDGTTGALTGAGSVATGAQPLSVVVSPSGKFAYVASNDGKLSAYAIDGASGALTPVAGSPFSTPFTSASRSVTLDPTGRFLFVAHATTDNVSAYQVDAVTGALVAAPGSPFAAGAFPISVAVDPSGRFAYVANYDGGTVIAYRIDATTGALSSLGARPARTQPTSVNVDPSGAFAYVVNGGSGDVSVYGIDGVLGTLTPRATIAVRTGPAGMAMVGGAAPVTYAPSALYVANSNGGNTTGALSAYLIDPGTGALGAVAGSPFPSGWNTQGLAASPAGTSVYVANYNPTLTGFAAGAGGALSPLPGSPYAAPSGQSSWAAVVDPSGRFAYYANYNNGGAGSVSAFTIHPTTGALTPVAGSAFPAGNGPVALDVDPTGRFLYVANAWGHSVSAFIINPTTGAPSRTDADPTTVGVQDFSVGSSASPFPNQVKVDPTGRFVYVANSGEGTVSVFAVAASTGALTRLDADPGAAGIQDYALGRALTVTIDPSGRHAYFIKDGGFNQVLAYGLDAATGALTYLSAVGTGATPRDVTLDPSGRFAFVANYAGNSLSTYAIDPVSGALTALPSSPVALSGATAPLGVVVTGTIR